VQGRSAAVDKLFVSHRHALPTTRLDPSEHRLGPRDHLELMGALPPRPRLAIVGSRAAHARYLATLELVVARAHAGGWSIVSGGALGVDAGAHRAALRQGCPQLAVLPCGPDRVYPPQHAPLFAALLEQPQSGLVFAHPSGTPSCRAMFASRNRLVVALADAVLVVEASLRSGSLGTGRLARKAALPLAAFAGSAGCGTLIAEGALALPEPLARTEPDAHDELGTRIDAWLAGEAATLPSRWPPPLAWLRDTLQAGPATGTTLDRLGPLDLAMIALVEAELLGLVCEVSPGRWRAIVE
jgi:DNA processing protein